MAEVRAQTDETSCPIGLVEWFDTAEDGIATLPVVVEHCRHVICLQCFTALRGKMLKCPYHGCHAADGNAYPNLEDCHECREWNGVFAEPEPEPEPKKIVLTVRASMIDLLRDKLQELEDDDARLFRISAKYKKALLKHWRTTLRSFEAQYHRWHDLAELLDPFRGSDVIHDEDVETYGAMLLKPLPQGRKEPDRGFLKPDPALRGQFPKRSEPWISTSIRTLASKLIEEEGEAKEINESEMGEINQRHELHHDELVDEEGTWVEDWPVKQLLRHRFNEDGEIEYLVQYLGFVQPTENEWKRREEFSREQIWQKYDAKHGIPPPAEESETETMRATWR